MQTVVNKHDDIFKLNFVRRKVVYPVIIFYLFTLTFFTTIISKNVNHMRVKMYVRVKVQFVCPQLII